jgi:Transposase DDE domain
MSAWRYPKWAVAIDRQSLLILAQLAYMGPSGDVQDFAPLTLNAHVLRPSHLVVADSGYNSSRNLRLAEEWMDTRAVMRIRNNSKKSGRRRGEGIACPYRRHLFLHCPRQLYRKRNSVECAFSAHKRRFGDLTPSRTWNGRFRDCLLRGVLHNCALLVA